MTPTETELLVRAFEDKTLPLEVWRRHSTHLTVATWYLLHHPAAEAENRIRLGIQGYNAAHGIAATPTSGYHETVTVAFVRLLERHLANVPPGQPLERTLETVVHALGDQRVLLRHYSTERLMSTDARLRWVEPDRAPL